MIMPYFAGENIGGMTWKPLNWLNISRNNKLFSQRILTLFTMWTYNYYKHSNYRGLVMPDTIKKTTYFLDIEPELRNKVKALAALKGKTMKDWLTEAIIAKLEDEIDASEGLASLADNEGTMSLWGCLESPTGELKRTGEGI